MYDGLLEFLKHVGPLLRVLRLLTLQKPFKQFPLAPEFKSPMIKIHLQIYIQTFVQMV